MSVDHCFLMIDAGMTMMRGSFVVAPLLLLLLAATTSSSSSNADDTAATESDECLLWVAPSTIPGAGLGVFNGYAGTVQADRDDALDVDQIGIPLVDVEFMNGRFEGKQKRRLLDQQESNWRGYLMNFFISLKDFGLEADFPQDSHMFVPGTGCLANCHFALNNVEEPGSLLVDTIGLHRSTDPGVGGFSSYHGYHTPTLAEIPVGAEIFGSYGQNWFEERQEIIGMVPMVQDWEDAEEFWTTLQEFIQEHPQIAETTWQAMYGLLFKRLHEDDFDAELMAFVSQHLSGDISSFVSGMADVTEALLDLGDGAILALPKEWSEASLALKLGSLRALELQKSTRSLDDLRTHGRCMDGLVPGNSTIPQAGRGAFARRAYRKGDYVTHAPLLHVIDKEILRIYSTRLFRDEETGESWEERDAKHPVGWQILINYCFGRNDTSLLLCPYGSSTPYINHSPADKSNVKIAWATDASWFDPKCLDMTLGKLAFQHKTCLAIDYIATRDIQPGEEILLDYGPEWQQAWDHHMATWAPDPHVASPHPYYVRAQQVNDLSIPVKTLAEEQAGDPYPGNLRLECYHLDEWHACDIVERIQLQGNDMDIYLYNADVLIERTVEVADEEDEDEEATYVTREARVETVKGLQRDDIRFVEEWFSGDEFLPNAFRHSIKLPDELLSSYWITNSDTEECMDGTCLWEDDGASIGTGLKTDFVAEPHLQPGEIEQIRWAYSQRPVNQYSARVGLDPKLSKELLAYAERLGIIDMYWDLLQRKEPMVPGSFKMFRFDPNDDQLVYYVNRPEKKWHSNMHWANAANEHTHEEFLKVLAAGNFDQTLDAIGRHFELDGIFVQGVSFIGVSQCDKGYLHHDMTNTGGKFFNVLWPLIQVENAPPEFMLRDDETELVGYASYIADEAMVVGDDAYHGTAACDYLTDKSGIRISAAIYIADVNEKNVETIVADTTTIFPVPEDQSWAMASKARHWGGKNRLVGDKGRGPITSNYDKWKECAELAAEGACDEDIWSMRANCVKTCGVFVSDDIMVQSTS